MRPRKGQVERRGVEGEGEGAREVRAVVGTHRRNAPIRKRDQNGPREERSTERGTESGPTPAVDFN